MAYSWKIFKLPRFYGLDLKTNVIDVKDGFSLDCSNVLQNKRGVISKRSGNTIMFVNDLGSATRIDEIGSATLAGTKYYFCFAAGNFYYATSLTGALTEIVCSPAVSTTEQIWWAVLDGKLFFVDNTNVLRYFDGTDIETSAVYQRPTVAPSGGVAGAFTYTYTVDNGLAESPAGANLLVSQASASTITIQGNTGPQTLIDGDVVRIYSRADTIAAASKLVATYTWTAADVTAGNKAIATVAISDTQVQLYSELGVVLNKTAPSALTGITVHYGRLVGWKGDYVYNSKVTNPHSWPDDTAQHEAFVYGYGLGDGESIQTCVSFRESLVVMKQTKMTVFGGIGPDDTGNNAYTYRRLETNGLGCTAPKSAVVVGDQGKLYLVYLSQQGFMATNGDDPVRIGEKIETSIQAISIALHNSATAFHHKREGVYVCFIGSDGARTAWILDVREDEGALVGWFKWTGPQATSVCWDDDRYIFGTHLGYCGSERVSAGIADFADIRHEYVDASDVDTTLDQITVSNSYLTGDTIRIRTTGTIPAGLTANTTYYVIRVSATEIKLALSSDDATVGTAINITSQGTGTHSLASSQAIASSYTTNWFNFKSAAVVKKLAKPAVIMNAQASSVNITISTAYDWVDSFEDTQSIVIGSSHLWGDDVWGAFTWGSSSVAIPKNVAIARRKVRSIRYKFANSTINQDLDLQGIEQPFDYIRNRGNFA